VCCISNQTVGELSTAFPRGVAILQSLIAINLATSAKWAVKLCEGCQITLSAVVSNMSAQVASNMLVTNSTKGRYLHCGVTASAEPWDERAKPPTDRKERGDSLDRQTVNNSKVVRK
jgi:hypothetical protein